MWGQKLMARRTVTPRSGSCCIDSQPGAGANCTSDGRKAESVGHTTRAAHSWYALHTIAAEAPNAAAVAATVTGPILADSGRSTTPPRRLMSRTGES